MKRKLLAFSMTLALLLSVFSVANVGAHTVFFEGNPDPALTKNPSRTDWFGVQPDTGQGAIMRNKAQQGEFVFNDATKDQRLISTTSVVTRAADLDWFSVTADKDNIYFLAKVERYNGITQSPAIQLLITIDTDHASSSDPVKTQLPITPAPGVQTKVPGDAAWEYTVDTTFQPGLGGNNPPFVFGATKIWTNSGGTQTPTNCAATTCKSQLAAASVPQGNFAEIGVPWSAIGGAPTGANFLRFTVATLYSNHAIPLDGFNSPVIDVLGIDSTLADIQDGTMNTSFDVHFDTNPAPVNVSYEPYAPLVITEFQANPVGDDDPGPTNPATDSEWIEIYNPNTFAVNLTDYKIGNAAKRSTAASNTQGMFRFNSGSLAAKATVILAKIKTRFLAGHPGFPNSQVLDLTNDMTKYTAWANGSSILLDNGPNPPATTFEEQVLLLDAKDDIVDLVNYGNPTTATPGNIPIFSSGVAAGVSFERCPAGLDTNGGFDSLSPATNNADFITRESVAAETPGIACVGRPGVDMQLVKTTNLTNAGPGDTVVFTLSYSNVGTNNEPAPGMVTIADTLPAGLTFVSASVAPTTQNGQNLSWTVPAPNAGGLPSEINVTTTIDNGLGENVPLVNNASITSPSEPTDTATQANNAGQATVTTLGPALLNLNFEKLGGKTPPNITFEFKLNYSNTGQDDATDTTITLNIPANVTLVSADAPGASANFTTPIVGGPGVSVTWSIPNLASNTGGSIALKAQVANDATLLGSTLSFTAQAQGLSGTTPVTAQITGSQTVAFNKVYMPMIMK
jgi:uncharacterized repeat protein (TIGR01451 family)